MIHSHSIRPRRTGTAKAIRVALLASALSISQAAIAQDAEEDADEAEVLSPLDLFDAGRTEGVQVTPGLVLRPSMEARVDYDSNVYNIETGKLDDFIGVIRPQFLLQTNDARHYSELRLNAELRRHADITSENSEQFEIAGRTDFDLGNRIGFTTLGGVAQRIEMRGTSGDQFFTDEPVKFTEAWASAELSRTGGQLELFGGADFADYNYQDATSLGVPIDLSARDAMILRGHVRANYSVGPSTKVFAIAEASQVNYDFDLAVPRDSVGFSTLYGVQYQISALIEAEAAIGFVHHDFDDPATDSVNGIDYEVAITWTPTPRLEFTAGGQRNVDPSPLGNVPALVRSQFDLAARTVMGDRILLETRAGFLQEDYRGIDRNDDRYFGNAALLFRVTDNFGAKAQVGYRKQNSNEVGESYDGVSFGVGLTMQI